MICDLIYDLPITGLHTCASVHQAVQFGTGLMGEVWPTAHIAELCLHLLPAQGLINGDEH